MVTYTSSTVMYVPIPHTYSVGLDPPLQNVHQIFFNHPWIFFYSSIPLKKLYMDRASSTSWYHNLFLVLSCSDWEKISEPHLQIIFVNMAPWLSSSFGIPHNTTVGRWRFYYMSKFYIRKSKIVYALTYLAYKKV